MSFLGTIIAHKRREVATRKIVHPLAASGRENFAQRSSHSLSLALQTPCCAIIAEVSRSHREGSEGRGIFDPVTIAREYVAAGASALSIPIDEKFLIGHPDYLRAIREAVDVPILCRDFVVDQYQLAVARMCGADAILLMAAANEPAQTNELAAAARDLGLEALVEVSCNDQLDALDLSLLQGVVIENRDPDRDESDIYTSIRIRKQIPRGMTVVAQSGIMSSKDCALLKGFGINAVLVGAEGEWRRDTRENFVRFLRELCPGNAHVSAPGDLLRAH